MIKNVSYTFLGNLISFFVSAFVTFIVPKCLGVEAYGYFQLYMFYVNYTGFLHFGWADGVFLRYGGEYYERLDRSIFSGQFWLYSGVEVAFGLLICLAGYILAPSLNKGIVLALTGISVFLLLPRTLLQYILQGTNRIREYATLTVL